MPTDSENPALIEVMDDFLPEATHVEACKSCAAARWHFGHESHHKDAQPFWALDLSGDHVFSGIWDSVRERCEQLTGQKLRVIRQYATGHTYGLGGKPHTDDTRPGCFTLLYYAMPEWQHSWDGETVFFDGQGEVMLAVRPKPNRAILFDSRVPHAGRAPSRACPALRVAAAFKLEPALDDAAEKQRDATEPVETSRDGAQRVYTAKIKADRLTALANERLAELGKSLRLPGFRPGHIPQTVLEQRYGATARTGAAQTFSVEAAQKVLSGGGLVFSTEASTAEASGDLTLRLTATHLPDLPDPDFVSFQAERLTTTPELARDAGVDAAEANAMLAMQFRTALLDQLDAAYEFSLAAPLLARELAAIRTAAEPQLATLSAEDRKEAEADLRTIAERRVRLGAVIAEMARRYEIRVTEAEALQAQTGAEDVASAKNRLVEDHVLRFLASRAQVTERVATREELTALREQNTD